jgi:hypothetical protein
MLANQLTWLQRWGFSVGLMDSFLLTLFQKYSELLKRKFSVEFENVSTYSLGLPDNMQIVGSDDYMPMPINTTEEYDNIMRVCWYFPDKADAKSRYGFLNNVY